MNVVAVVVDDVVAVAVVEVEADLALVRVAPAWGAHQKGGGTERVVEVVVVDASRLLQRGAWREVMAVKREGVVGAVVGQVVAVEDSAYGEILCDGNLDEIGPDDDVPCVEGLVVDVVDVAVEVVGVAVGARVAARMVNEKARAVRAAVRVAEGKIADERRVEGRKSGERRDDEEVVDDGECDGWFDGI